jgi:hypothetical protein
VVFIMALALYAVAVRPGIFREREEIRAHLQKEEAQHQKYVDDWDRYGIAGVSGVRV